MGGLIYAMPKTFAHLLFQEGPIVFLLCARSVVQTVVNVGEVAVDTVKLVGYVGYGVFYSLWWVGESAVWLVAGENADEKVIEQISDDL